MDAAKNAQFQIKNKQEEIHIFSNILNKAGQNGAVLFLDLQKGTAKRQRICIFFIKMGKITEKDTKDRQD